MVSMNRTKSLLLAFVVLFWLFYVYTHVPPRYSVAAGEAAPGETDTGESVWENESIKAIIKSLRGAEEAEGGVEGAIVTPAPITTTSTTAQLQPSVEHPINPITPSTTTRRMSDEQERLDDQPPPLRPTSYDKFFGEHLWQKPTLPLLQLHNIPSDDWLINATAIANRCDLEEEYEYDDDGITLVSALLDLGRGKSESGTFQRSMQEYYNRFNKIIATGFKMVIYCPLEFADHLKFDPAKVKIIPFHGSDLKTYFPYYDRLQEIRTSKLYQKQAEYIGYLKTAPQNKLPLYNPLVMSKMFFLRDAAKANHWRTKYHMWLDAGHFCAYDINPTKIKTFTDRMQNSMLVTYWPYGTTTEVHGMTDKAFHMYMGQKKDPLMIVRGGVFGGPTPYIKCATRVYLHALAVTLGEGYLGTEENVLAMIYKHFPHLFTGFDNDSLGNHGDNCALFIQNKRDYQ